MPTEILSIRTFGSLRISWPHRIMVKIQQLTSLKFYATQSLSFWFKPFFQDILLLDYLSQYFSNFPLCFSPLPVCFFLYPGFSSLKGWKIILKAVFLKVAVSWPVKVFTHRPSLDSDLSLRHVHSHFDCLCWAFWSTKATCALGEETQTAWKEKKKVMSERKMQVLTPSVIHICSYLFAISPLVIFIIDSTELWTAVSGSGLPGRTRWQLFKGPELCSEPVKTFPLPLRWALDISRLILLSGHCVQFGRQTVNTLAASVRVNMGTGRPLQSVKQERMT